MKLYKVPLTEFTFEHFYESPVTMTFYKDNIKALRVRDVSHILPLENNLYLFGVGDSGVTGKYIIKNDMFDFCICERSFAKNFQTCQNLLRDFKQGRSGIPLSKRIDLIYKTYQIDFLERDYKIWLPFIFKHYNYDGYYVIEKLNLDETNRKYLTIEVKVKKRSKL